MTFKPTKAGNFTSNITLIDKNNIKHTFVVRGVASATANLELNKSEFDLGDLKVGGETKTATVTLKNTGEYPLQYVFPKFSSAKIDGSTTRVHKFGYTLQSNVNGDDSFDYEPAPELADETDITSQFNSNNWQSGAVKLGFEFPFYGKKYTEMYIYNTGFVSFDKPVEDYKQFPEPPASLPTTETFYSNIICPFWGNHSMNTPSVDGVYYKANEDDVVVSYKNYGNTMMQGMNFQVILRKDGSFKFQYDLDPNGMQIGVFGLCGIMDHTETRGITPSDMYINPGNALEFTPYKNYVVAPGKSATLPIELFADKLADVYNYELSLKTNAPANESVKLPVALNITGAAEPVFPTDINVEQVVNPYPMEPVYHEFQIENKGSKAFTIDDVASELFAASDPDDPWSMPEASLEVYTDANSGGGGEPGFPDEPGVGLSDASTTKAWIQYQQGMMAPITVGKEPVKFRISLYDVSKVRQKDYPIHFAVSGLEDEEIQSTIKVNITKAPVVSFDQDELHINNVSSDYTGETSVKMLNEGGYKLKYSLRLEPSGRDEQTGNNDDFDYGMLQTLNVISTPSKAAAKQFTETCVARLQGKNFFKALGIKKVKDDQKFIYDVPAGVDDNMLYYPVLNPVKNAQAAIMGTGESALDENFYAATRYEAPAEGFNLTHLYFVGTVGNLENVDIEASVILGNDVTATERTIGHGKLHVEKEEETDRGYMGVPRMLKFDNPVYINPADTFYVVLKYPAGYKSSALMATKDGNIEPNRYMAHLKSLGGWVDIENLYDNAYSYGAFGYFMTCVEHEKGEPWIKLLNEQKEGVLEANASLPINFQINAKSAYFAKNNKATLVVKSNDPENATVNYHIYLDRNAAPAIEVPEGIVAANQGESTNVELNVSEPEDEAFSVSFEDSKAYTTVASYNEADGVTFENGVFSVPAGKQLQATLNVVPEYGYDHVGSGAIVVNATDASNNASSATVNYNVVFKNRAPEFVGQTEITLGVGEQSATITYASLFNDPDGDKFTGSVYAANTKVAAVFSSDEGFIISAKKVGKTSLNVTATDSNGDATPQKVMVNVVDATGISSVGSDNGDITVSTDGDNGTIGVKVNANVAEAVVYVYDAAGKLIAKKTAKNLHAGDTVTIDIANSGQGVYTLNAVLDGESTTVKFVK